MQIPVQLDQLLTLALSVVMVTQVLKAISARIDSVPTIGGFGSIIVSAVVAVILTLLAYGAGWVPVSIPTCTATDPFGCVQGWLATAGAAIALANLLYAAVYVRVFGSTEPKPTF